MNMVTGQRCFSGKDKASDISSPYGDGKTPHVMLVGEGAQQFALSQGFELESGKLSGDAQQAYDEWLKKSEYKPKVNIENTNGTAFAPRKLSNGAWNHDTIGMLAIDANGNSAAAAQPAVWLF